MILLHVLTGKAEPIAAKSGVSGIRKRPVPGPVRLTRNGVEGDTIVDTAHHGGPEQAVYVWGAVDHAWWEEAQGGPLLPGTFGENLHISGLQTGPLALGDQLEIGNALLEVTAPRVPCVTLEARMDEKGFMKKFLSSGRPGAYARVLTEGTVEDGNPVFLAPVSGERVTIAETLEAYRTGFRDAAFRARLARTRAHKALLQRATA